MPTAYSLLLALAQGVFWVSLIHTASGRAYVNNPSEHAHSTVAGDQLIPCTLSMNLLPLPFTGY